MQFYVCEIPLVFMDIRQILSVLFHWTIFLNKCHNIKQIYDAKVQKVC